MNISNLHFMKIDWLIDWLIDRLIVSVPLKNISFIWKRRIANELVLKFVRRVWPLSREGSLLCHVYCDTHSASFFVVSSNEPPHLVKFYDKHRTLRTYHNSGPHHGTIINREIYKCIQQGFWDNHFPSSIAEKLQRFGFSSFLFKEGKTKAVSCYRKLGNLSS